LDGARLRYEFMAFVNKPGLSQIRRFKIASLEH
jgi:hypothetical protein